MARTKMLEPKDNEEAVSAEGWKLPACWSPFIRRATTQRDDPIT